MPSSLGGGAIIAFAAVLWLLYLAPSWVRRRQYLATERNAVRLQQTLRILAETAEVPDEVRAEVSARSVAEQHRVLRDAARRAEAVSRPREAAAERTLARSSRRQPREPRQRADAVTALASARLRRARLLGGTILLLAIGAIGFGLVQAVSSGSVVVLVVGVVAAFAAVALLQRAATASAAHRAVVAVDHAVTVVQEPPQSFTDWQRTEQDRPTWTPVPLPKPLYLGHAEAPTASSAEVAAAAATLRQAAKRADDALRSAHAASGVAAIDALSPERKAGFAAMGIVQETEPVLQDLDAVLRRRRAG